MSFDFGEAFTLAARHGVPLVRAKRLKFSFDCETGGIEFPQDPRPVQCALHRLLCAVVDLMQTGFVLMVARAGADDAGQTRVMAHLGGAGRVDDSRLREITDALGLELFSGPDPLAPEHFARGICPHSGGQVELHCVPNEGLLITLGLSDPFPAGAVHHEGLHAQGARVWLVNVDDILAHSWTRRFQRLGWAVSIIDSGEEAVQRLQEHPDYARPALVVVREKGGAKADCHQHLPALVPDATVLIYAVQAGSAILQGELEVPGYEVRVYPFSPADLATFTRAAVGAQEPSGLTQPAPLTASQMPSVLIVDDKPLNVVVGRGMAEALGYRVATADSGAAAIEQCRRNPPDVILLDVQMPGLSGLDVCKALRRLQRQGDIPPFAIVGFTASWTQAVRQQCLASGMDECLPKPVDMTRLGAELKRFSTMR